MKDEQFKPYIPADKITPEFTVTSVIMGMLLAVVFGAANAYLGLREVYGTCTFAEQVQC